jgi:multidrug efflux pump subunit AcrB
VRTVFQSVGRDNPRIYYNVMPRRDNPAVGQLFVVLDHFDQKRTPALLDSLRAQFAAYPAARIQLREFENGPPIDAPIEIRVHGTDLDTLRTLAAAVERVLEATPGTRYVDNPVRLRRTDLRVTIDREKAGLLGVPTLEIDRTLRLGIAGVEAGVLREADGDERDVVVRLAGAPTPDPATLDRLYIASLGGKLTPLRQVADVRFEADVPEIRRVDRERAVTVTSFVQNGHNTNRVTREALATLDSLELPQGYRIVPAGEIESRQESFGGIGSAIIVATFLILAVLVLEFGTFRGTLIVASVIPLDDRLRGAGRDRDQDLDPAGGLHQPAPGGRHGAGGGDPTGGRSAVPAHRAHQHDGDRRAAAARAPGTGALRAARVGDHRRAGLVHAARPHRDAGAVQAHATHTGLMTTLLVHFEKEKTHAQ